MSQPESTFAFRWGNRGHQTLMRLYLDDDSVAGQLVRLLRQVAHDVLVPADVGLSGEDDGIHFTRAASEHRVPLSHNYGDFWNLHNLSWLPSATLRSKCPNCVSIRDLDPLAISHVPWWQPAGDGNMIYVPSAKKGSNFVVPAQPNDNC